MDKRTKHTLMMSGGIIFVLLMISSMFYLGSIIRPVWVIILCEALFSFVIVPRIVYLYYKLYKSEVSLFVTLFIPIYNATLAMSKLITNLILANIAILVVVGLLALNSQMFYSTDLVPYLKILDVLNYSLFSLGLSFFILNGIGFARVYLKINELYKLAFDNSEVKYGFLKFLDLFFSASTFMSAIIFAIPVVRIIPAVLLMEKCSELDFIGATFYDYYDLEEYDEEDEE